MKATEPTQQIALAVGKIYGVELFIPGRDPQVGSMSLQPVGFYAKYVGGHHGRLVFMREDTGATLWLGDNMTIRAISADELDHYKRMISGNHAPILLVK